MFLTILCGGTGYEIVRGRYGRYSLMLVIIRFSLGANWEVFNTPVCVMYHDKFFLDWVINFCVNYIEIE